MIELGRFSRNMPELSEDDCRLLAQSRVGVFGCGGVGGYVAEMLARMGVGFIRMVDFDIVEETNLNRQLFATEHTLGIAKTQAGVERLAEVNSSTIVDARCTRFDGDASDELLDGLDLVVNEIDALDDRVSLIRACFERGLPVAHAAVNTWRISACTLFPQDGLTRSFDELFSTDPEDGVLEDGTIVLTALPFNCLVAAGICASKAVRVLIGREAAFRNKRYILDLRNGCSNANGREC